ncbi:MAG: 3-phosphoglycerate dehydrogenase [Alphaproteobacteria bacterium]|nr:3-phosphoglycerate dehydrogenase [Alphaproteobacteria bacterium]
MLRICYFDRLLNLELFESTLTQGHDIELTRVHDGMTDAEVADVLSTIHGYHTRGGHALVPPRFRINEDFLAKCPKLVAACTAGAGYDIVNLDHCSEAGVLFANQAGLNAEAVAEHAIAMMMCLSKKIAQVNMALRRDPDLDRFAYRNNDVFEKTIGIVGLGHIGTRVAEVCSMAFRMNVLATHPRLNPEEAQKRHARLVPLDELLEQSDFVLVACGLNDETRGMFGAEAFEKMKPSAYFLTIGRGGIHDEEALAQALEAGQVAGAGLDVWMQEPPPIDHPLLKFDNVLASPHIAANTVESAGKGATGAAIQWHAIMEGKVPVRLKNPDVWPNYTKRFEKIMGFAPETYSNA